MKTLWFNKRKAMSTILGALIFIGILFSALIPMTMVMNQADTIYEQEIREQKMLDDEKSSESINVWAYPIGETEEKIKVRAYNLGYFPSKIVRVWINDVAYEENTTLPVSDPTFVKEYDVDISELRFDVKVTTEKGNVIQATDSLSSFWDGIQFVWNIPGQAITVVVLNEQGKYLLEIYEIGVEERILYYESQGTEFEDIIQTFLVDRELYEVHVYKFIGGDWTLIHSPIPVPDLIEEWDVVPIKYVFIDGETV